MVQGGKSPMAPNHFMVQAKGDGSDVSIGTLVNIPYSAEHIQMIL